MDVAIKDLFLAFFPVLIAALSLWFNFRMDKRRSDIEENKLEFEREKMLSSETYQELFKNKITIYQKINSNTEDYLRKLQNEIQYFYDDDHGSIFEKEIGPANNLHELMHKLFKDIEGNEFLLSIEILEQYKLTYKAYKFIKNEYDAIFEYELSGDPEEQYDANKKFVKDIEAKLKQPIHKLIDLVNTELNKVRKRIAF